MSISADNKHKFITDLTSLNKGQIFTLKTDRKNINSLFKFFKVTSAGLDETYEKSSNINKNDILMYLDHKFYTLEYDSLTNRHKKLKTSKEPIWLLKENRLTDNNIKNDIKMETTVLKGEQIGKFFLTIFNAGLPNIINDIRIETLS